MYIHVPTMTYPVKESVIKARILEESPNVSFAKPFIPPQEYQKVVLQDPPSHHPFFESVDEAVPVLVNGSWQQQWQVRPATPEELMARQAVLQAQITAQTQERLDAFARTRNYDNILSACTYASSAVTGFRDEGQYCVNMRDATWAALYDIMAQVQAGTRPMPTGYADIEASLPVLEWPV